MIRDMCNYIVIQKIQLVLTRDNETGAVALARLPRVAVACGAAVVIQPILRQDVQDVQGSRGCDEISLSWKRPKQRKETVGQRARQPSAGRARRSETLKEFADASTCADLSLGCLSTLEAGREENLQKLRLYPNSRGYRSNGMKE